MINPFKNYVHIGYVQRPHGTHGELILDLKYEFEDLRSFAVDLEGSRVPFRIEECTISGLKAYVKLAGIDSLTDCEFLKGNQVFIDSAFLPKEESIFHELIGYEVTDKKAGLLGLVTSIENMPQQRMLFIDRNGEEILIPYHKDLIMEIDHINKKIISSLPEDFL